MVAVGLLYGTLQWMALRDLGRGFTFGMLALILWSSLPSMLLTGEPL